MESVDRISLKVLSRASKACLCAIVISSQMMSLHSRRIRAVVLRLLILQTENASVVKSRGNLNAECAVRPFNIRVAPIPELQTPIAIAPPSLILESNKLRTKVFLIKKDIMSMNELLK